MKKQKLTFQTRLEYARGLGRAYIILCCMGCLRFGEEKLRVTYTHGRHKEVDVWMRLWHPIVLVSVIGLGIYELARRLASTIVGFARETLDEFRDNSPWFTLRKRVS